MTRLKTLTELIDELQELVDENDEVIKGKTENETKLQEEVQSLQQQIDILKVQLEHGKSQSFFLRLINIRRKIYKYDAIFMIISFMVMIVYRK